MLCDSYRGAAAEAAMREKMLKSQSMGFAPDRVQTDIAWSTSCHEVDCPEESGQVRSRPPEQCAIERPAAFKAQSPL